MTREERRAYQRAWRAKHPDRSAEAERRRNGSRRNRPRHQGFDHQRIRRSGLAAVWWDVLIETPRRDALREAREERRSRTR